MKRAYLFFIKSKYYVNFVDIHRSSCYKLWINYQSKYGRTYTHRRHYNILHAHKLVLSPPRILFCYELFLLPRQDQPQLFIRLRPRNPCIFETHWRIYLFENYVQTTQVARVCVFLCVCLCMYTRRTPETSIKLSRFINDTANMAHTWPLYGERLEKKGIRETATRRAAASARMLISNSQCLRMACTHIQLRIVVYRDMRLWAS